MARGSIQERVNKDGTTSYIAVIAYKDINTGNGGISGSRHRP